MICIDKIKNLQSYKNNRVSDGNKVVLVPTMGNLHQGHLSLVEHAKEIGDDIIVSIFVNPVQFVEGEDYENYPRTLERDLSLLKSLDVDLVFNPLTSEIYPEAPEFNTRVYVPSLDNVFCGKYRPGHFTGVATVVTILLNIIQPDMAVFGEKDYQQLLVIKKLVKDLCIPVEIIGCPTVREADGLAMSSRNQYLDEEQRKIAPDLYNSLVRIAEEIRNGNEDFTRLQEQARKNLLQAGFKPEYVNIQDAETLDSPAVGDLVILASAWLGRARLIDNIIIRR